MQSEQGTSGRRPHSSDPAGDRAELEALRATSRRQLMALDTLSEAGAAHGFPTNGRAEMREPLEVVLPADDAHVGTNGTRPLTAGTT